MPTEVVVSDEAISDLETIERWLTQPGAGPPARRRFQAVVRAIDDLPTTAGRHPTDRFNQRNRQLVVRGYTISYQFIQSAAGNAYAVIERVYFPGQDRTLKECVESVLA